MNLLASRNVNNAKQLGEALLQAIEGTLDMKPWGFVCNYKNFNETSSLVTIYDSQWCRLSFRFSRQQFSHHDELSVEYGRLHAPNEKAYLVWESEECHCWHNIIEPLLFLDGLTPLQAMEQSKIQRKSPPIVESFRQSEVGQKLYKEYAPQAVLAMHGRIWEHYGQRLFELFDLQRPDLWEKYRAFVREYYRLIGMESSWGPPYENVC